MVCVQYMMDSGTLQGMGGDTLVSCRDNEGRGGETESGLNEVNAHPIMKKTNQLDNIVIVHIDTVSVTWSVYNTKMQSSMDYSVPEVSMKKTIS